MLVFCPRREIVKYPGASDSEDDDVVEVVDNADSLLSLPALEQAFAAVIAADRDRLSTIGYTIDIDGGAPVGNARATVDWTGLHDSHACHCCHVCGLLVLTVLLVPGPTILTQRWLECCWIVHSCCT